MIGKGGAIPCKSMRRRSGKVNKDEGMVPKREFPLRDMTFRLVAVAKAYGTFATNEEFVQ